MFEHLSINGSESLENKVAKSVLAEIYQSGQPVVVTQSDFCYLDDVKHQPGDLIYLTGHPQDVLILAQGKVIAYEVWEQTHKSVEARLYRENVYNPAATRFAVVRRNLLSTQTALREATDRLKEAKQALLEAEQKLEAVKANAPELLKARLQANQ